MTASVTYGLATRATPEAPRAASYTITRDTARTGRSKSRLNFLSLLRARCEDYVINDSALDYMHQQKVAPDVILTLAAHPEISFASQMAWYDLAGED